MRIAHVTSTFPPYYGGTGNVCYQNALGLSRMGHEVTVLTAAHNTSGDHPYLKEITVRRLPPLFRIGNAPCLPQLFQLRDFDLVHLHCPFPFGEEILFLRSWMTDVRYVIAYHQDLILRGLIGPLVQAHHTVLGQRILARAKRLMVSSLDYASASRIASLVGRLGDKVVEMPYGVDTARFHPGINERSLRERYGLTEGVPVILFVGAMDRPHYFKGVHVLLRSLARVTEGNVKLILVGGGDLLPVYQALAERLEIGNRVIFCGRVPDKELAVHYCLCDFLVLPSVTMGEAFGLVLLEAMACGKPVIASNLPGVRTVVTDGEDGLLAQPGDVEDLATKIRSLLSAPQKRKEMGLKGRAKTEERYDWQRIAFRLEQTYEQALAG